MGSRSRIGEVCKLKKLKEGLKLKRPKEGLKLKRLKEGLKLRQRKTRQHRPCRLRFRLRTGQLRGSLPFWPSRERLLVQFRKWRRHLLLLGLNRGGIQMPLL